MTICTKCNQEKIVTCTQKDNYVCHCYHLVFWSLLYFGSSHPRNSHTKNGLTVTNLNVFICTTVVLRYVQVYLDVFLYTSICLFMCRTLHTGQIMKKNYKTLKKYMLVYK